MKKNYSFYLKTTRLVLVGFILSHHLVSAQCPAKPTGCAANPRPIPQMWLNASVTQPRFQSFSSNYSSIFSTTFLAINYKASDLMDLTNLFVKTWGLSQADVSDSIRVFIGKCGASPNPTVPQTNGFTLIFCPIKDRQIKGYYVITTATANNLISLPAGNTWISDYFSFEESNLINKLESGDKFNHLGHDAVKMDLSNTVSISYLFDNWYDFFNKEILYQGNSVVDGISASFACYGADGDHGADDNDGTIHRKYRIHIIYQYLSNNNPFKLEITKDFCCRYGQKRLLYDSLQVKESQFELTGVGKKLINQQTLKKEIEDLKKKIRETGGDPNGSGGDSGQSNP